VVAVVKYVDVAVLKDAGVAIVDVRNPDEFSKGHLADAINVPLDKIRADAQKVLTWEKILFVCARGSRSMEAAGLATAAGVIDVYSLEGGTLGWQNAGFPVSSPPPIANASLAAGESDDRLDPALDHLIADNLRELRKQRGWSLDDLARMMNVSRSLLGQIELGNSAPSVAVVWKIARAFDVPFATMLATATNAATSVMRKANAKRLVSPDGRFSSRALFPFEQRAPVEFYELRLGPHSREDAEPHAAGTRENIVVIGGQLELEVANERYTLDEGDAIVFAADVAHAYVNRGNRECWMNLVMTYASYR
jgi:rhodanese-related sulfurtransferase/transcriptional regulator with XRE-family HTH domain